MTPFTARLCFTAFLLLGFVIAVNALLLQPAQRKPQPAVTITTSPAPGTARGQTAGTPAPPPAPAASPAPVTSTAGLDRVSAAILRELVRKGYPAPETAAGNDIAALVLAYEFDSGGPLTGRPTEDLLKRLLFDLDRAPRGSLADRVERDQALVLSIQKTLLQLGFFSGALTGRMDEWTQAAIAAFERHRKLTITSRLGEATLLDLIAYTGEPIQRAP
jgi:hypothetical protein